MAFSKREEMQIRKSLISNIWEDVAVRISKGKGESDKRIIKQEFRLWIKIAIDLCGPPGDTIIHTEHGDLTLDKEFTGKIYLKGLHDSSCSPSGMRYVFCYNFSQGYINRDRERLTDQNEEAQMLAKIWGKAITC